MGDLMGKVAVAVLALGLAACSEFSVTHGNEASAGAEADILVEPAHVDFGEMPELSIVTRTVRIANRGGAPLEVQRVLPGPNLAFEIPDLDAMYLVEPGEAVLQEVQYTATNATDTSWLRILSNDPDQPELDVTLAGGALVPELTIDPDPVTFGEIPCLEQAPVVLRNTGGAPLTIDGVIVTGAVFTGSDLAVPQVIEPGGSTSVVVTFEPGVGDLDHVGQISVSSDDPRGIRTAGIEGSGIGPPHQVEVFEQVENDWTKIDISFFVDRSGSMTDDAANLGSNFDLFSDILDDAGIDYQIAAVTFDDGCANNGIITPLSPDPAGLFLDAVEGPGGAYSESGMIVTRNMLEATDAGECNAGFLRAGVTPVAVMVSDEPEQSPGGYAPYLADMLLRAPNLVITTIVGQPGNTCGAADGTGYHEAAAATAGADLDICDPDWGSYFYEIIGVIDPPLLAFPLTGDPDPSTITVTVDGAPGSGWLYDAAANDIVFFAVSPPPPASVIEVAYDEVVTCL